MELPNFVLLSSLRCNQKRRKPRGVFTVNAGTPLEPTQQSSVAPLLSITSPDSRFEPGTEVLLFGRVTAQGMIADGVRNQILSVYLDGQPVDIVDDIGNFFAKVSVLPGRNFFSFSARDTAGFETTAIVSVRGIASQPQLIDLSRYTDVTESFGGIYGRTSFNEANSQLIADIAIQNDGSFSAEMPLLLGVKNLRLRTSNGKRDLINGSTLR